ncbi:hypothetical protein DFH09DRAFT_265269 [Mycena vulgaris]|nr:hypothetical protein DFH09DRAFT_265269 [Mycena vulgaris]
MPPHTTTIEKLCHDPKTRQEANNFLVKARTNTAIGSGFDLGEARTGLPAVCAFLASEKLNNTDVTIQAAQVASCQTMPKFRKLVEQVRKALAARKPARRDPLTFESLVKAHCDKITKRGVKWMYTVEASLVQKLDADEDEMGSDDEITCAVFTWVCNVIEGQRLFHTNSFEDKYDDIDTANMRYLAKLIKSICGRDFEAKIRDDYAKPAVPAAASPRKSPSKPALRTLPSRDSPQKRKVTFPNADADADDVPAPARLADKAAESRLLVPRHPRVAPPDAQHVRLPHEAALYALDAPQDPCTCPPRRLNRRLNLPRKRRRLPPPLARPKQPPWTLSCPRPTHPTTMTPGLPPRRRFRPIFRDQQQWALCDPRLVPLAAAAADHTKRMIKRYGVPFQDYRAQADVAMDSD